MRTLNFVWLEITGSCQLTCVHCYAGSSPQGNHGTMSANDWVRVIDQVADADATSVQFIGGEPTLHPRLPDLINHALGKGLRIEVFSNLYRVTPAMREILAQPGVSLATSYSSDEAAEHDGDVWPCVFTRWLPVGNVLAQSLAEILDGGKVGEVRDSLTRALHAAQARRRMQARRLRSSMRPWVQPDVQSLLPANL